MKNDLDKVVNCIWMNNEDCNIFLIGELHDSHTKCIGILDMLNSLMEKNVVLQLSIDLMIEYTHFDSNEEAIACFCGD